MGTLSALFQSYDADRSGHLGFDEYIQALAEITVITNVFRVQDTTATGTITVSYETFLGMALSMSVH